MRIKGVTGGKMKGTPIELSPKEKASEAVKEAVSKSAPEGWNYYCDSVNVITVTPQTKGPRTDGKPYANNTYASKGDVVVRRHKAEGDKLFPAKTHLFDIRFEDITDSWGMPDIKVGDMKLSE